MVVMLPYVCVHGLNSIMCYKESEAVGIKLLIRFLLLELLVFESIVPRFRNFFGARLQLNAFFLHQQSQSGSNVL